MKRIKKYLDTLNNDYDKKTKTVAFVSLAVTFLFALVNGFWGIYHASLWYGTMCIYYLIFVILLGFIIVADIKISRQDDREHIRKKIYFAASLVLLILNISLIVPIALMVKMQRPVEMSLIPAIAVAAYTTYRITMAAINLKKRKKTTNILFKLYRAVDFIDALVSVLILQNTLVMVVSKRQEPQMLPLMAGTSAAIWIGILLISVMTILRGINYIRRKM